MKKVRLYIFAFIAFVLIIFYFGFYVRFPSYIPLCHVKGNIYFTNVNQHFEKIDENYEYYGTTHYNKFYTQKWEQKDLTTNFEPYKDKEVYVDKNDDTFIFIKDENNQFLQLYHEEKQK